MIGLLCGEETITITIS